MAHGSVDATQLASSQQPCEPICAMRGWRPPVSGLTAVNRCTMQVRPFLEVEPVAILPEPPIIECVDRRA